MRILIGKGEQVGDQELATVVWIDEIGMLILGPGAEEVAGAHGARLPALV